jgi:mono/diheme cytochrome c family protein
MKLLLGAASALSTALLLGTAIFAAPSQYQTMTVVLPAGDPQAGRRAFVDLKCTVCHRVEGEARFPAPLSESQGPELNRTLALRPASDVAAAIIVPSHSMSVKTSEQVKKQLRGMKLSPMPDYSRTMTVRQLADLLAYVRSLSQSR